MKRILFLGAMLALFGTLTVGCSKDDGPSGEVKDNYLKVKVDGVEKNFAVVSANWVQGGGSLSIYGMNDNKESVTIHVFSQTSRIPAGQYSLDDNSGYSITAIHNITNNGNQVNSTASRGTDAPEDSFNLKIDKIDNGSAQGSFSGVLIRVQGLTTLGSVAVTEGQFKVSIKEN